MLKIGLTGGIGSGKSTVARIFETLGVPVHYADNAAKRLMLEDAELRKKIIETFGTESYINDQLNRKYISAIVFKDPQKLTALNALVHPATIKATNKWIEEQKAPYLIKEAALIFESGSQKGLDYVIGVSAPKHLRIQRVMNRDGHTREEILSRMDRQISEDIKMKLCDFIIKNDEQELVLPQVLALHEQLMALAAYLSKEV